jgi:hypothetical protein
MTDKWGRRVFKTGAVVLILLGLVHTLSLLEKPVPANATEKQLFDLMSSYQFHLMGSLRSMGDLLRGFSVCFSLAMLGTGAMDLLLAGERTGLLKRVALVNAIWLAVLTDVSLHYFFAAPTSFLVAGLLLFALAWLKLPAEGGTR